MTEVKQNECHIGLKKPLLENILENIKNIFVMRFAIEIFMMKSRRGEGKVPQLGVIILSKELRKNLPAEFSRRRIQCAYEFITDGC